MAAAASPSVVTLVAGDGNDGSDVTGSAAAAFDVVFVSSSSDNHSIA